VDYRRATEPKVLAEMLVRSGGKRRVPVIVEDAGTDRERIVIGFGGT
jgi:hypothetical protein